MTERNDGGPAFPGFCENGMSLRQWYAGMALTAILGNERFVQAIAKEALEMGMEYDPGCFAKAAFGLADSMLEAGAQKSPASDRAQGVNDGKS